MHSLARSILGIMQSTESRSCLSGTFRGLVCSSGDKECLDFSVSVSCVPCVPFLFSAVPLGFDIYKVTRRG